MTANEAQKIAPALASRVARGGLFVAVGSYVNIVVGFVATLFLTRMLAPEVFGIVSLATFFFSVVNLRPKLGAGQAFAQRKETTPELIGTFAALDIGAGLVSLVLASIAAPILLAFGNARPVIWAMLVLAGVGVSDAITGVAWALQDKELHFGRVSLVTVLAFPLSYLPAFLLAARGGGVWSLLAQNATYALLLLVGMWWSCLRYLPHVFRQRWRFDRVLAGGLLRFGLTVGLATITGMIATQFDNFLVGSLVSLTVLGFYDRAYRIAQWPALLVSNAVTRTAFYTYARLQDDHARLNKTFTMTLWLTTSLALPVALAIFASAPDLVRGLWGARWLPSAPMVRILVICACLRPILDNANSLFVAVGVPRKSTIVLTTEAVILVLVGAVLTRFFGVIGTAVAVGIAFTGGLVLAYAYVGRIVRLSLSRAFAFPGAVAVLSLLAYFAFRQVVHLDPLPPILAALIEAAFTFSVFLLILLAVERRTMIERGAYVWRLLRRQ